MISRVVDTFDEDLRLAIYRGFATSGRAGGPSELAAELGTDVASVNAGINRLADGRHLVLADDGSIVLAHPFAARSFGFAVMGSQTLWWGGCAWDSFAIPHLVPHEPDVLVSARCPACDNALAWVVSRDVPPTGDEVAHFLVPMAEVWDDVVRACGHQQLFCSRECVDVWLGATGNPQGYVMDLATLWRLAEHWYDGRLGPGYTRREPAQAREYFRRAGLIGEFWGLEAQ
jgi:hypothetical protein